MVSGFERISWGFLHPPAMPQDMPNAGNDKDRQEKCHVEWNSAVSQGEQTDTQKMEIPGQKMRNSIIP